MNTFIHHIHSLPALVKQLAPVFADEAARVFTPALCDGVETVYMTGCGDSFYAAQCAEFAIESLTGLNCEAQPAMQFSRYAPPHTRKAIAIGVSVSGGVSRTIEAMARARKAGHITVALTSSANTALAQVCEHVLTTSVPDLPDAKGVLVPGSRSFYASLLMLLSSAVVFNKSHRAAKPVRFGDLDISSLIQDSIITNEVPMRMTAEQTLDARTFVFAGSGPNLGSVNFAAAKMIESCGDVALAADLEEWAHVQYWMKQADTPTFLLSANGRDKTRADEVETAMRAIGRRVIRPALPACDEALSPFAACIPPMLFAAHRAELLGEPYFRAFGGGRSPEGGGGISRIRTSEIVD
ncbi:MAG: SIS domain-containing protein [Anaerolineae bacterium]|nr:SIS domain-containing protein [Thermoflexales bacterium]HQW35534.1 SIS domain-containing protein [Thermoflexales bacterium]